MGFWADNFWKSGFWANGFWAGVVATTEAPQVGDGRFWRKGNRPFPRPRYWWEIDPTRIPDVIELPDELDQIKEEEDALAAAISEMLADKILDGTIRILSAYAEIIAEQREAKEFALAKREKEAYEYEHSLTSKVLKVRKRKIMLLMN